MDTDLQGFTIHSFNSLKVDFYIKALYLTVCMQYPEFTTKDL